MLEMRPDCEKCGRDLPADQFEERCPNCGGVSAQTMELTPLGPDRREPYAAKFALLGSLLAAVGGGLLGNSVGGEGEIEVQAGQTALHLSATGTDNIRFSPDPEAPAVLDTLRKGDKGFVDLEQAGRGWKAEASTQRRVSSRSAPVDLNYPFTVGGNVALCSFHPELDAAIANMVRTVERDGSTVRASPRTVTIAGRRVRPVLTHMSGDNRALVGDEAAFFVATLPLDQEVRWNGLTLKALETRGPPISLGVALVFADNVQTTEAVMRRLGYDLSVPNDDHGHFLFVVARGNGSALVCDAPA